MSALLAAGPASAQKVGGGTFHHEGSQTDDSFCGVSGLVVDISYTFDGRFLERLQGRHSTSYGVDNTRFVGVYTRRATGQTVSDIQPRTTSKDLKVTDNGDGTLTSSRSSPAVNAPTGTRASSSPRTPAR